MFRFIKNIIGLLSVCTLLSFRGSFIRPTLNDINSNENLF